MNITKTINPNTMTNLFARAIESKYKVQNSETINDEYEVYLLKVIDSVMRSSTYIFHTHSTSILYDLNDEDIDINVNYSKI